MTKYIIAGALFLAAAMAPLIIANRASERANQNTEEIHRMRSELDDYLFRILALEKRTGLR